MNNKPKIVVWCVEDRKFIIPCERNIEDLPSCACDPMKRCLNDLNR